MKRLEGNVAIVTGAALGLGHATAVRMAEEGAAVALLDTLDDEGRALAAELRARDLRAQYWHCDVTRGIGCGGRHRRGFRKVRPY